MSIKEQITKIKEYADIADASYAMLQYIEENDEAEDLLDDLFNLVRKPPSRWIYADGIKRGYKLERDIEALGRKQGQPTAYALAIEARFSQDKEITIKKENRKIENTIQNFIERKEEKPELENQEIKVSTTKEKMEKEKTSYYLSYRTKAFTSRYEVVEHQKNTSNGFSATLFRDCENSNQLILACRGTEFTPRDIMTDLALAQGDIPLQCYDLARFYEEKIKRHLKEEEKLLVIGHSLGGYLAQSFALMYPHKVKELYTFNAPGVLENWSKERVKEQLELLSLVFFGLNPSKTEASQWIIKWIGEKLRAKLKNDKQSLTINIQYNGKLPKELEKYEFFVQNLKDNILVARSNPDFIPHSLKDIKILHIETTNTLDTQKHLKTWLSENATQHLGKDIRGKYLFLYVPEEGVKSHYLDCTLKTLYFYEYLLQNQDNHSLFLKDSLQESCNALGIFTKTIYQNMYDKTIQENNEEAKRCFYSVSVSCYNSSLAMQDEILQIPNPIIAVLDKALFESTLITKEEKQDIKEIQIFEAIAYLQEHNILISVMQDNTIKAISSNSPLAYLLSIYEFLPFICTNKDSNPLIQNIQDFKSLTQRATSTKISVFSNTISEKMIEVYKNQTLLYSAETTYRGYVEKENKKEQKERKVEIIAKDSSVKIEKISDHSRKILEEIGTKSENYRIVITDVARTPKDQAEQMYNLIENEGISGAKRTYKKNVHSVIELYADCKNKGESKLVIQQEMETEIKKLIKLGYFQHCQDFDLKNTFDISVRSLDNHENFLKFSKDYEKSNNSFKIIDESRNKDRCFHIEIKQPTNKEQ